MAKKLPAYLLGLECNKETNPGEEECVDRILRLHIVLIGAANRTGLFSAN